MRFLCRFILGFIYPLLVVFFSVLGGNGSPCGIYRRFRQVYRVGTHIGDMPILIQFLCQQHGLRHGVTKLAAGLLL